MPQSRCASPDRPSFSGACSNRMSSHPAHTHTTSAPPRGGGHATSAPHHGGGLSLGTLLIAAASSAAAATVVSRLWQAGTVMAAAMTPVIVSLVKEALERPAKRVSSIATRSAAPPVARATRAVTRPPEAQAPPPPTVGDPRLTEMRVYGDARRVRRRWKLAVATGLLGFVVCVAAMTVPELVAGRSVVSGKHDTTIFGGQRRAPATTSKPEEKTKTDEGQTTTDEIKPEDETPPAEEPQGTTTTAPTQPAPEAQPTQPAPTQTQPPQAQPTVPEQQPAPTTP